MKGKADIPEQYKPWLEPLPRAGDNASLCPECNGASVVLKTSSPAAGTLTRYRRCLNCLKNYKTVELYAFGDKISLREREGTYE